LALRRSPSVAFLVATTLVIWGCDLGTKEWAQRLLAVPPGRHELWDGHLALVIAKNSFGSWGLARSLSDWSRFWLFLLGVMAASVLLVRRYRRLQPQQWGLRWALPMVLGGMLGNETDRLRWGYVLDFINLHAVWSGIERSWTTCNLADVAIRCGIVLALLDVTLTAMPRKTQSEKCTEEVDQAQARTGGAMMRTLSAREEVGARNSGPAA
jgi:signal peptidase II